MLVMSKGALSVGQAETYYQEKYSEDDYYTESHRVVGEWYGRGAETLGLSGAVSEEDFRAILRGTKPDSGEVLVSAAAGRDERRAGWDATFNAPKSVSIQALVGEDSRLVEAHRHAVEHALSELEAFAQARRHRGQEWVTSANIVAARFDHIAARPSETGTQDGYGPDPHLHTHVVIANMTLRPDTMWRSLDPVEIYRSQSSATAVYRSELGREVQALGYRIAVTAADGRWELQGYTREQVMAFSRRRQDIEALLNHQNSTGAAAAQIAAHQSRLAKEKRDENELRAESKARAHENRIALAGLSERARGFAPTTRAVKALSEAGIQSRTVASLLASPLPDRAPKELWIIDESSLLGTHQMNALLHKAREAEVGRSGRLRRRSAPASRHRGWPAHPTDAAGGHARRAIGDYPSPTRSRIA
jgi:conjugative relaxase-like TrwC/TraI family protein